MPSQQADPDAPQARWQEHLAIAIVSMTVLLFQILVTRLLSVTLSYHFAFLAVSLAMLGLAAPGIWLSLRPLGKNALPLALAASGVLVPLSVVAMVKGGAPFRDTPSVWIFFLLLPLTALGSAVCLLLLQARGKGVSRMYAADLLGAAVGAVISVPLLSGLPTPTVLACLGLLPALALLIVQPKRTIPVACFGLILGATAWDGSAFRLRYDRYIEKIEEPLHEMWTPTARLMVHRSRGVASWGLGDYSGPPPTGLWIDQDGSAGTPLFQYKPGGPYPPHLLFDVTAAPYELKLGSQACIIGGGGGKDILTAKMAGIEKVEVAELNPWTISLVSDKFGSYSGAPYRLPGVTAHAAEGRAHFSRPGPACDVLQISQIDTFAASAAGAYALSENGLYTLEALEIFINRLSENGVLSISRWARGPAWPESVRLVLLVEEALKRQGVQNPQEHIAVVSSTDTANTMVFKRPISAEIRQRLGAICSKRGFEQLWPLEPPSAPPSRVAKALIEGPDAFQKDGLDLSPATDDRPFFFQTIKFFGQGQEQSGSGEREGSVVLLRRLSASLLGITVLLLFAPLMARGKLPRGKGWAQATVYFSCLGLGFMGIELPLLQRLALYLGHPSYATIVVLGSLLLGAGGGSMIAGKVPTGLARPVALAIPALIALGAFGLTKFVVPWTEESSDVTRFSIAALIVTLLGIPMGVLFPFGNAPLR